MTPDIQRQVTKALSDEIHSKVSLYLSNGGDAVEMLLVLLKHSVHVARVCGCSAGRFIFWASEVWTAERERETYGI